SSAAARRPSASGASTVSLLRRRRRSAPAAMAASAPAFRPRELAVLVEEEEPHAGPAAVGGAEAGPFGLARGVVDHDHLVGRPVLGEDGRDAAVGGGPTLPGDDDGGGAHGR